MKLEDAIKEKTVVWCKTEDEAKRILAEADRLGYRWSDGRRYSEDDIYYIYGKNTCYSLLKGRFASIEFYKRYEYHIIDSTEIETEVNSLGVNLKLWDELVKDAPQSTFGQKRHKL